jgi:hypothetical protein
MSLLPPPATSRLPGRQGNPSHPTTAFLGRGSAPAHGRTAWLTRQAAESAPPAAIVARPPRRCQASDTPKSSEKPQRSPYILCVCALHRPTTTRRDAWPAPLGICGISTHSRRRRCPQCKPQHPHAPAAPRAGAARAANPHQTLVVDGAGARGTLAPPRPVERDHDVCSWSGYLCRAAPPGTHAQTTLADHRPPHRAGAVQAAHARVPDDSALAPRLHRLHLLPRWPDGIANTRPDLGERQRRRRPRYLVRGARVPNARPPTRLDL